MNRKRIFSRIALIAACLGGMVGCAGFRTSSEASLEPSVALISDAGPALGAPSGQVFFVVLEDFACAYCRQMQPVVFSLIESYGDRVRFVFKPFVNATLREGYDARRHPSHRAASAALAADRQGRFSEMSDKLFANQHRFGDAELEAYARQIGLDVERFNRDRKSPEIQAQVDAFKAEARAAGIAMTPAFVIGETHLEGRQSREALERAILDALGAAPTLAMPALPDATPTVETGPRFEDMLFRRKDKLPARTAREKIKVGDQAPDFTLQAVSGEMVSLAGFRGKKAVVLSFVPSAFTPVCSGQWPQYAAFKPELDKMDVQVLGITVDNRASQHAWLTGMREINFPVLSDFWPHGEVADKYGVLRPDTGTSERALFVVDKQGVIRFARVYAIDESPPIEELMEALAALR